MNEITPDEIAVNLEAEQVEESSCPSAKICKNPHCKHRFGLVDSATEEQIEGRLTNFHPRIKLT